LKVSANIKIAVQCFEHFGGGANAPSWLTVLRNLCHALCHIVNTQATYHILLIAFYPFPPDENTMCVARPYCFASLSWTWDNLSVLHSHRCREF